MSICLEKGERKLHTSSFSDDSPSTASIVHGLSGRSSSTSSDTMTSYPSSSPSCAGRSGSLSASVRAQRGVVSSPTPTRPRLSIIAGFRMGVTGSLSTEWSGVILLKYIGCGGNGGTGDSDSDCIPK